MSQGVNGEPDKGRVMRTPDGRAFAASGRAGALARAAGRAVLIGAGRLLRALWKLIRTIWRLAEALDSALWRGVKLGAVSTGRGLGATFRASGAAFAEVFRWLPTRSGRAYAAGSAVVLVLCSLWAADEIRNARAATSTNNSVFRPPVDLEDPILARIDGRYVHLSEIEASARAAGQIRPSETLTARAAFDRGLVEAYVEQRLLSRAATDEGLQRNPGVQRRISAARDRILAAAFMQERIDAAVTPDKVKRLYDSQVDVTRLGDEVKARHILVASEDEARAIVKELNDGADFGSLARARSLDRATAPLGGEVGWFTRDMMTPPFAAAAFSTPPGDVADPFTTEFGWHVLQVIERRATSGVPFAAVEDNVRRFLTMRTVAQTIETLKEDEEVLYFPPEIAANQAD
ncbi:MAG TPA: peptidylprolyl isomerase [Parvularculaceae bacterium]|nr:peptidylprolyl isomerase [Parvularculaceae bacterium]